MSSISVESLPDALDFTISDDSGKDILKGILSIDKLGLLETKDVHGKLLRCIKATIKNELL